MEYNGGDEFTGDLCMNATQNQVSVIAMKITEYRNGVKIGSVTRDIQIIVLACSTTPPIFYNLYKNKSLIKNKNGKKKFFGMFF